MSLKHARGFAFFVFFSLAIAAAAFAAKPISDAPPVTADVTVSASAMQWQAAGSFDRLALTVGGPEGYTFTKEFAAGTTPVLRLQDLGAKPADGSYSWELRVIPRIAAETRRALAAAREAGDDAAAARIRAEAGLADETKFFGGFTVLGGTFVTAKAEEPSQPGGRKVTTNALKPQPNDQVYADDVIIQGSACIGLDCVNNESFGFDTVRLKENNTRIKFDDTSTTAGCPNNDWQLTANDACGGANKFSIEDITGSKVPFTLTAGAPTNSIFVASSGKVGFGNSSPGLNLHITATDTPAIRQEQSNAGGFTAQTWDIGGNEANWFVRDLTGGSRLPLRIRPGAPTSSVDIAASGKVGLGTASPSEALHVFNTTNTRAFIVDSGNTTAGMNFEVDNAGTSVGFGVVRTENNGDMDFFTGTTGAGIVERLRIRSGGNVGIACNAPGAKLVVGSGSGCSTPTSSLNPGDTAFTSSSSRTFKENIEPLAMTNILDKIQQVPVVTYDFKDGGPKDKMGLIAEDFYKIFGRGDDKHINGQEVEMALWLAVQQLTAQNKELKDRLNILESQLKQQ